MTDELAIDERIYPCRDCGVMRSRAEGGTIFTVCDTCWDKHYGKDDKLAAAENQLAREQAAEIERLRTQVVEDVEAKDCLRRNYRMKCEQLATITADRDRLLAEVETLRGERDRALDQHIEDFVPSTIFNWVQAERDRYANALRVAAKAIHDNEDTERCSMLTNEERDAIDSALATSAQDGGKGEGR